MKAKSRFKQTEIGMIPEDWEVKKLGEITKFQYGLGESAEESGEYTYIRITDITSDNTLNKSGLVYISRNKVKENCILKKGDVLIARTGATFGKTLLFNENFKATYGGFLIKFIFNENLINNHFFFQYTRSNNYWHQAHNLVNGGAQPQFNANTISELIIPIPSLQEQSAIAKILSDLDSKIELLQKQNETLEKIGQAIFKHWFVDFEFPNDEGKPYKSSGGKMVESELGEIPEGWSVGSINNITSKFTTGLNPRKNFVLGKGNNYYVTIKNMLDQDIILDDRCDKITDEAIKKINSRSKLQKGDILFSGIGTIGRTFYIDETPENWNVSESVFTLRAEESKITSFLLYNLLLSYDFQSYSKQLASGSVQKGIRMADLKNYKVALPDIDKQNEFSIIFESTLNKFKNNIKEILSLQKTRDLLLPKLMTGKIRVPLEDRE